MHIISLLCESISSEFLKLVRCRGTHPAPKLPFWLLSQYVLQISLAGPFHVAEMFKLAPEMKLRSPLSSIQGLLLHLQNSDTVYFCSDLACTVCALRVSQWMWHRSYYVPSVQCLTVHICQGFVALCLSKDGPSKLDNDWHWINIFSPSRDCCLGWLLSWQNSLMFRFQY